MLQSWYSFILLIQLVRGRNSFTDPHPKFVVSKAYVDDMRVFLGENFGTMFVDAPKRKFYVGGKNIFYAFDLNYALDDASNVRNFTWFATEEAIDTCLLKGHARWECENYIRVLLRLNENGTLLVCGTNSQAPRCRYFEDERLENYVEEDGKERCPFRPSEKNTALMVDGKVFSGCVVEYTARDSSFSLFDGDRNLIKSKRLQSLWLKIPEFIASFEVAEWIVFFFREIAVEQLSDDKAVYSRVAKVCKNDRGGEWILVDKWTTFQKARLNCSFPGNFPFYFNYLQDVFMVKHGTANTTTTTFFGVFTTGEHEIPGSAVCAFNFDTIKYTFDQEQFKDRFLGSWYGIPSDDVPNPRPGTCTEDSKSQHDKVLKFIQEHPLMHSAIGNDYDVYPLFYLTRADFRLVQIAVHRVERARGEIHTVLFLGSSDGRILKVTLFKDNFGKLRSNFLEEIPIRTRKQPESILNIDIIVNDANETVILVNTNSTVVEVPLERCKDLPDNICQQDPYCRWTYGKCSRHNDPFDVENVQAYPDGNSPSVPTIAATTDAIDFSYESFAVENASSMLTNSTTCQSYRFENLFPLFYILLVFGWLTWLIATCVIIYILR